MPLNWIPNCGSQIERAIRKYCIDNDATPQSKGAKRGIYISTEVDDRSNPMRTILATDSSESPKFSGTQAYNVTIIDQFDALPQPENRNPDGLRTAFDRQIGQVMHLMSRTDDSRTLRKTCANITDAGRSLAPGTFTLLSGGETAANGVYTKSSDVLWVHSGGVYSAVYNATDDIWELVDASAVVLYTCTTLNFPVGPWVRSLGAAPAPVWKLDEAWNNLDMPYFTCLHVMHIGTVRGEGKSDDGTADGTWREVRTFAITAAPRAIVGYSNTEGQ